MRVKLLVGRAGTNHAQSPGDIITVSNLEGARMIETQRAVPVVDDERETATAPPPEVRAKKKAASKKKRRSNR